MGEVIKTINGITVVKTLTPLFFMLRITSFKTAYPQKQTRVLWLESYEIEHCADAFHKQHITWGVCIIQQSFLLYCSHMYAVVHWVVSL